MPYHRCFAQQRRRPRRCNLLTGACRDEWESTTPASATPGQCFGWKYGDFHLDYDDDLEGPLNASDTVRRRRVLVLSRASCVRGASCEGRLRLHASDIASLVVVTWLG
jgi:hypothetical protein